MSRRIQAICGGIAHTSGCQDVELHGIKGNLYLSLHLLIDRERPISEVHGIAEELESRLRIEFPQLGRIVIHAEPSGQPIRK